MRTLASLFIIFIFPFFLSEEKEKPQKEITYAEYCNTRFDFCFKYPDSFFTEEIKSDNGDGVILQSDNQEFQLSVAGSKNLLRNNSWELFDTQVRNPLAEDKENQIVYMIITDDYYESAFYKGKHCYYQKLLRSGKENIIAQVKGPKEKYQQLRWIKDRLELKL